MNFHVVALPHTQTTKEHNACAFTQKVLNFCRMMKSIGHKVIHYGAEGSDPDCDEHVSIISRTEQVAFCGHQAGARLYRLDWNAEAAHWKLANSRAAQEIGRRAQQRDFLCLIGGAAQKPISDALGPGMMTVEYGIGYNGTFAPYRVFESYAHMHRIYGQENPQRDPDGRCYDAVIPNYFDPTEFPYVEKPGEDYLYLGRLIKRKGIQIAVETVSAIGGKLLVAGQGCVEHGDGWLRCEDGELYRGNLEYVGYADILTRAKLMGNAKALFVPTMYLEPFGGVNVEAQMCGTPVITTDWGAFPETVEQAATGYRCRTLNQFVAAARNVHRLDRRYIHERAVEKWSLDRVRWMYHEYFRSLSDLWGLGWPTLREEPAMTAIAA